MPETIEGEAPLAVQPESKPIAIVGMDMPIATPAEIKAAMRAYQETLQACGEESDWQEFWQWNPKTKKNEKKRFPRKSLVRKIAKAFGVQTRKMGQEREEFGNDHFGYNITVEAWTPSGRVGTGTGACSTYEERFDVQQKDDESDEQFAYRQRRALARSYHDVIATAETRAKNRAILDLVGMGEVSADEISRPQRNQKPVEQNGDVPDETTAPEQPREKIEIPSVKQMHETFLGTGRGEEEWPTFVVVNTGAKKGDTLTSPQKIALFQAIQKLKPVNGNSGKTLDQQAEQAGLPLDNTGTTSK